MSHCILCPNPLDAATTPEHVWLKSLGGRKKTRRVYCDHCNNSLGSGPDKALAESVALIRNLMNFPDGTGKAPPTIKAGRFGADRIALKPGGVPVIDGIKPFTITELPGGNAKVELRVTSTEHLQRILPDLARALGMEESAVRAMLVESGDVRHVSQRVSAQSHRISLGGPDAMRSMLKTCLTLWADRHGADELEKPGYADAKRFAKEGGEDFVRRLTSLDIGALEGASALAAQFCEYFNLACAASDENGRVVGYFRLYNFCGWRFAICEAGGPASSIAGLVSNPEDPASWEEIKTPAMVSYKVLAGSPEALDFESPRQSLLGMLTKHHSKASADEINRICDDAARKTGITPDQPLTQENFDRYVQEVAHRIASWMVGVPFDERLSAEDIARLLGNNKNAKS